MHLPGAYVPKPMHPAPKLCRPGAGCTLNFEHCRDREARPLRACIQGREAGMAWGKEMIKCNCEIYTVNTLLQGIPTQVVYCYPDMGYNTAVYYKCMQSRPKSGEGLDAGEGRGAEEGWEGLDTGVNF